MNRAWQSIKVWVYESAPEVALILSVAALAGWMVR